jgi:hypothetical protein
LWQVRGEFAAVCRENSIVDAVGYPTPGGSQGKVVAHPLHTYHVVKRNVGCLALHEHPGVSLVKNDGIEALWLAVDVESALHGNGLRRALGFEDQSPQAVLPHVFFWGSGHALAPKRVPKPSLIVGY